MRDRERYKELQTKTHAVDCVHVFTMEGGSGGGFVLTVILLILVLQGSAKEVM